MSAYYDDPTMRDWFVGGLFAVAACLFLYKGLNDQENWLLNGAATLAVGTAVFPHTWKKTQIGSPEFEVSPHGVFAVSFFVLIGLTCWLCKNDSVRESLKLKLIDESEGKRRTMRYKILVILLIAAPLAIFGLQNSARKFWAEAAAVIIFAIYWMIKTGEIEQIMESLAAPPSDPKSRAAAS